MRSRNNFLIVIGIFLAAIVIFNIVESGNFDNNKLRLSYSQFLADVQDSKVVSVTITSNIINGLLKNGQKFSSVYPIVDTSLIPSLKKHGVDITVKPLGEGNDSNLSSLYGWLFLVFLIGLFWFLFSRGRKKGAGGPGSGMPQSGGMGGPFSFGRSKAKMFTPQMQNKVTFEDVAGVKEAKEELVEVVDFLKDSDKFTKLGAKIPRGCLLVGSPGTGKTLLAKAVAGEANVPFFIISGSDFVEMFVGVGASRVRDLFEQAKNNAPCIIFIDEIDAVGRQRGAGLGGGNDEREQTLNQLLVEMDGFSANQGVIVIAATNRPDVLDPALLRPGRFDRQVNVPYPDIIGREQILRVHSRKVPIDNNVNITVLSRGTTGFSGADLANLVNEAALMMARENRTAITMNDFEQARDKIMMGPERKSMKMTEDERELTAYHEAGHTIIALNVHNYHPLHKVTIIPRGRALGVTAVLPEKDMLNYSFKQMQDQLTVLFGGRLVEEMIYGKDSITTGASNDIKVATNLARRMVVEWGFSDKLGRVLYEANESEVFLGHAVAQKKNISEATAELIDEEIKRIIDEAESRAKKILNDKKKDLEKITRALLVHETLTGLEVRTLLDEKVSIDDIKQGQIEHVVSNENKLTSLPIFEINLPNNDPVNPEVKTADDNRTSVS